MKLLFLQAKLFLTGWVMNCYLDETFRLFFQVKMRFCCETLSMHFLAFADQSIQFQFLLLEKKRKEKKRKEKKRKEKKRKEKKRKEKKRKEKKRKEKKRKEKKRKEKKRKEKKRKEKKRKENENKTKH
jgi:hypothetical protein